MFKRVFIFYLFLMHNSVAEKDFVVDDAPTVKPFL